MQGISSANMACFALELRKTPGRKARRLGCGEGVFSNRILDDLERLWGLRQIIPDPCNPNMGNNH